MEFTKEVKNCKKCGEVVDDITAAKNEGMCKACFTEKVKKLVHPF